MIKQISLNSHVEKWKKNERNNFNHDVDELFRAKMVTLWQYFSRNQKLKPDFLSQG